MSQDENEALRKLSAKLALAIVETTDMASDLMKFCDDEDILLDAINRMTRISLYIARAQKEAGLFAGEEPKRGAIH